MVKLGQWEIPESELNSEIEQAREQARRADDIEPRALSARFDRKADRIIVDLANGCTFAFPPSLDEDLSKLSASQLAEVTVTPSKEGLRWKTADVYLSVPGLLMGVFGSKSWMAAFAARAGSTKTAKKAAASRENGKKGGRPKKKAV
jgi:hypothetical protein